jgi:hypothetical protein
VGKTLVAKRDAGKVARVFHFCPDAKCFTNPKDASNREIPVLKNDSKILVDPTIGLSPAERNLLRDLNLIFLYEGQ